MTRSQIEGRLTSILLLAEQGSVLRTKWPASQVGQELRKLLDDLAVSPQPPERQALELEITRDHVRRLYEENRRLRASAGDPARSPA